ncbi:MAG: aminotransferase class III-fold pyridoxal phosphate-dependent enzyme, partial [Myxococcota bacterium]
MSEEQGFLSGLLAERAGQKFDLHSRHMNHQLVRVLRTIGFDRHYTRAEGAYLYDEQDARYLDLLSGFGTFALGRNHPGIRDALREVLDAELPNLVQLDVGALAAILAEQLVECMPGDGLDKVFFANSGTETVEAAIKFARFATGRAGILYCEHGFHGLTMGSLALNGEEIFRRGFGPMLPDCHSVP